MLQHRPAAHRAPARRRTAVLLARLGLAGLSLSTLMAVGAAYAATR